MNNPALDPFERSIPELQAAMQDGRLTALELTRYYLERIERYDRAGPRLNSVLEVNPDALAQAQALDAERAARGPRGPLHGIPVLLKDNIDTADRMHTSAGSLAMKDAIAPQDAFLVRKLRKAGAVLLGKTNMTEWANFMTVGMPPGYSSRGGQVVNPYGAAFHPGGSSAGSGVAPSANLAAAAVGTETQGSILNPASQNAIVGIKPTVGLVSRSGIIPISATQDTAGPMARTVTDAAILLSVLAGEDPKDPATQRRPKDLPQDYTAFLDPDGLKGARIGVPRAAFFEKPSAEARAVLEEAIQALRDLGATVIDPADLPTAHEVFALGIEVLLYEFKQELNRYFRTLGPNAPIHSLQELIRYNEAHPEEMLRYGQVLLLAAESAAGVESPTYRYHRAKDLEVCKGGLDATFAQHRLDALVFPMNWGASVGAKAGYPSLTVPAGYTPAGQPVGLTFLGPAWSEATLIRLAYAFEQGTHARKPPVL
ncbi:amidase [Marinithermus hydrothermalis]|uniref:Amidase n=1 Tax=Marinithermus hydrothermalis (strain DSM 14884 / JCM 11576 / T1) TaxID=869210 RepID=F2NNI6_MARHT|nr:amidase [Marinithermus hydrothermalis]AEB11001.1 Amidase [Marinithermus hydrothermalis DSM 14884]